MNVMTDNDTMASRLHIRDNLHYDFTRADIRDMLYELCVE